MLNIIKIKKYIKINFYDFYNNIIKVFILIIFYYI